jgi:hypothetical protein
VLGLFLLPHLGSRVIAGWLYNRAGSQRVDRRLVPCHAQRHRELHRPGGCGRSAQFEVLVIMDGIVVLAGAIIAVTTRGRLGLKRPEANADLNSEG